MGHFLGGKKSQLPPQDYLHDICGWHGTSGAPIAYIQDVEGRASLRLIGLCKCQMLYAFLQTVNGLNSHSRMQTRSGKYHDEFYTCGSTEYSDGPQGVLDRTWYEGHVAGIEHIKVCDKARVSIAGIDGYSVTDWNLD